MNIGRMEHFKVDELLEMWIHSEDTNYNASQTVDPGR